MQDQYPIILLFRANKKVNLHYYLMITSLELVSIQVAYEDMCALLFVPIAVHVGYQTIQVGH